MDHPHALSVVLNATKMVILLVLVHRGVLISHAVFSFCWNVDVVIVQVVVIGDLVFDAVHF